MSQTDEDPAGTYPRSTSDGRFNSILDDATRRDLLARQLIERLADHALGQVELTTTQLRAIDMLLKRIEPDLRPSGNDSFFALCHEDALAQLD